MSPEELSYCNTFIEKWKKVLKVLTGGIAGMILKAKYGKLKPIERRNTLLAYLADARELSDKNGKTQEMRMYILDEACRLIEELLAPKK